MAGPGIRDFVVRAPGRVNLIGEHVDYAGGLVLPAAIDLGLELRGRARPDGHVRLLSRAFPGGADIPPGAEPAEVRPRWAAGAAAVLGLLRRRGEPAGGFDGVVAGDLPAGAGLSSSAAFLVSVALAARAAGGAAPPDDAGRMRLALLCRDAEELARGVRCGIMDPVASLLGREGAALLIDCRSGVVRPIPVAGSTVSFLVADTGVRRDLSSGDYNRRRTECEEVEKRLGGRGLRDCGNRDLEVCREVLGPVLFRRARHVVTEIARTERAAAALGDGDVTTFGRLLVESHESLRLDFDVSTAELDALVAIAVASPGVLGARLTGAGFGGGVLVAARPGAEEGVGGRLAEGFRTRFGRSATVRVVRLSGGAEVR
ncbi:MAG: galactokinase [Planctomycetes bacterium]|nr:galactokinase [Planctomycetota bacterium]